MSWVKIDDQFSEHPKVMQAGPLASWLYVRSLCYTAKYLTDGFIPQSSAEQLAMFAGSSPELLEKLVECSLWERRNGGYQIHDYLDYNPTGAQVKAERAAAAERMRQKRDGKSMFARTSPELRPNFAGSSSPPSPSPSPSPSPYPIIEEIDIVISEEAPHTAPAQQAPPPTKTPADQKPKPASKPVREDGTTQQTMFGKIAEICDMDADALTGAVKSQIGGAAKQLIAAGATADRLTQFRQWWDRTDWRGKKHQAPTPPQIVVEWPKFSANGNKTGNAALDTMIREGLWQPGQPL